MAAIAGIDAAIALKETLVQMGFSDCKLVLLSDCASMIDWLSRQQVSSSVSSSKRLDIDLEIIREAIEQK